MMNFMKMRTFYKKKLPLFIENSILHTYKKLKPQIEILWKTPFLEIIETPGIASGHFPNYPEILLPIMNMSQKLSGFAKLFGQHCWRADRVFLTLILRCYAPSVSGLMMYMILFLLLIVMFILILLFLLLMLSILRCYARSVPCLKLASCCVWFRSHPVQTFLRTDEEMQVRRVAIRFVSTVQTAEDLFWPWRRSEFTVQAVKWYHPHFGGCMSKS